MTPTLNDEKLIIYYYYTGVRTALDYARAFCQMSRLKTSPVFEAVSRAFQAVDKSKDGLLSVDNIEHVLKRLGVNVASNEALLDLIRDAYVKGSGLILYADLDAILAPEHYIPSLRSAFDFIDKDRDGYLNGSDIHTLLVNIGECWSDSDLHDAIKEADRDRDGTIGFKDFCEFMGYLGEVTDAICEDEVTTKNKSDSPAPKHHYGNKKSVCIHDPSPSKETADYGYETSDGVQSANEIDLSTNTQQGVMNVNRRYEANVTWFVDPRVKSLQKDDAVSASPLREQRPCRYGNASTEGNAFANTKITTGAVTGVVFDTVDTASRGFENVLESNRVSNQRSTRENVAKKVVEHWPKAKIRIRGNDNVNDSVENVTRCLGSENLNSHTQFTTDTVSNDKYGAAVSWNGELSKYFLPESHSWYSAHKLTKTKLVTSSKARRDCYVDDGVDSNIDNSGTNDSKTSENTSYTSDNIQSMPSISILSREKRSEECFNVINMKSTSSSVSKNINHSSFTESKIPGFGDLGKHITVTKTILRVKKNTQYAMNDDILNLSKVNNITLKKRMESDNSVYKQRVDNVVAAGRFFRRKCNMKTYPMIVETYNKIGDEKNMILYKRNSRAMLSLLDAHHVTPHSSNIIISYNSRGHLNDSDHNGDILSKRKDINNSYGCSNTLFRRKTMMQEKENRNILCNTNHRDGQHNKCTFLRRDTRKSLLFLRRNSEENLILKKSNNEHALVSAESLFLKRNRQDMKLRRHSRTDLLCTSMSEIGKINRCDSHDSCYEIMQEKRDNAGISEETQSDGHTIARNTRRNSNSSMIVKSSIKSFGSPSIWINVNTDVNSSKLNMIPCDKEQIVDNIKPRHLLKRRKSVEKISQFCSILQRRSSSELNENPELFQEKTEKPSTGFPLLLSRAHGDADSTLNLDHYKQVDMKMLANLRKKPVEYRKISTQPMLSTKKVEKFLNGRSLKNTAKVILTINSLHGIKTQMSAKDH